jgi:hypothetical protein
MAARSLTGAALLAVAAGSAAALVLAVGRATLEERPSEGRAPTPTELVPAVEAAFPSESYAPGETARLVISNHARGLRLQVFRSGPERVVTRSDVTMNGVPVSPKIAIGASGGHRVVRVQIGDWPSGLYFARLAASTGESASRPSSSGRGSSASIASPSSCRH